MKVIMNQIRAEVVIDLTGSLVQGMQNDPMPIHHKIIYCGFLQAINKLLDKYSLDCSGVVCMVENGKVIKEDPACDSTDKEKLQVHMKFLNDLASLENSRFLELLEALYDKCKREALDIVQNGYFVIQFSKQQLGNIRIL